VAEHPEGGGPSGDDPGGDSPRKPPRGLASRRPPRVPSRYSIIVGLAFVALIVVAIVNAARNSENAILGGNPAEQGTALTEFAVPDAVGGPSGDANVFQDDCQTSDNPCPPDQQRTPACEVDVPNVIRVCDLFNRPLVISFWFTRFADCLPSQDEINRLSERYRGRVNFLSIDVRDDIEKVRSIVAEHGWTMPVGYDADGEVSNVYHVGGCPTVVLAYPGGILAKALIGDAAMGPPLIRAIGALLRESRLRAATDR
jgi:thiol-disulfide isomerase/thioredoxin